MPVRPPLRLPDPPLDVGWALPAPSPEEIIRSSLPATNKLVPKEDWNPFGDNYFDTPEGRIYADRAAWRSPESAHRAYEDEQYRNYQQRFDELGNPINFGPPPPLPPAMFDQFGRPLRGA